MDAFTGFYVSWFFFCRILLKDLYETPLSLTACIWNWISKLIFSYRDAYALRIGSRNIPTEDWQGIIGDILIRKGSYPGIAPGGIGLRATEQSTLSDIYQKCGGKNWKYRIGTDAVGGGTPWIFNSQAPTRAKTDPWYHMHTNTTFKYSIIYNTDGCCAIHISLDGWFGILCDSSNEHIVRFFPNTRYSGNPLTGCQLPESVGNLTFLEHAYFSNDKTPSSLHGPIPDSIGNLEKLKCLYFSHTGLCRSENSHYQFKCPSELHVYVHCFLLIWTSIVNWESISFV